MLAMASKFATGGIDMPRAIFEVPFVNANAVLPAMSDPEGGVQLHYDDDGVLSGGFSLIGHVTPAQSTCLVLIHSSKATITAMAKDVANEQVEHEDDQVDGVDEVATVTAAREKHGVTKEQYQSAKQALIITARE